MIISFGKQLSAYLAIEIYKLKSGDNWIENSTNLAKTKIIGYEGDYVSESDPIVKVDWSKSNICVPEFAPDIIVSPK